MELCKYLKRFYSEKPVERGGFILNGEIIECENDHPDKTQNFSVSCEDLEKYENAEASWHTHPNGSKNLSRADFQAFQNWPQMRHYIVGKDGVFCYVIDGETGATLVLEEESCL